MATSELHLDELTYARAKRLAEERKVSVEELVAEAIERLAASLVSPAPQTDIIGAFADRADLMDEVVEEAYQNRQRYPLRLKSE